MDLSPHEDLHTGLSVWQSASLPTLAYEPLRSDVSTDVLVVGAGISGALAADSLSDAGLRVVVADRRRPVSGATAASTALIQYDLDLPLVRLAERIGTDHANRVWQRARLAMDALYQRTRHLGIDAGFERRDSLYLDFLRAASSRGARIASPVDIIAVSPHANGVTAETADGPRFRPAMSCLRPVTKYLPAFPTPVTSRYPPGPSPPGASRRICGRAAA